MKAYEDFLLFSQQNKKQNKNFFNGLSMPFNRRTSSFIVCKKKRFYYTLYGAYLIGFFFLFFNFNDLISFILFSHLNKWFVLLLYLLLFSSLFLKVFLLLFTFCSLNVKIVLKQNTHTLLNTDTKQQQSNEIKQQLQQQQQELQQQSFNLYNEGCVLRVLRIRVRVRMYCNNCNNC